MGKRLHVGEIWNHMQCDIQDIMQNSRFITLGVITFGITLDA